MLFNSFEFLIFLPVVFILYWFVFSKNVTVQNVFVLAASYVFYGWWDWRFLSLIFASTLVDYVIGRKLSSPKAENTRKLLLWSSIVFNLSILFFFKYCNFFIESWIELFEIIGYEIKSKWILNVILPVGISFYTFQTISYTIEVYRKEISASRNFIDFAAFVSFFPQLVAGPIEKAQRLLPQIQLKRKFNYSQTVNGLRLILYGLFKKVVIADSLAPIVDQIFDGYTGYSGGVLLLGAFYFSVQIYCDFSGYSDIAIGIAKTLGFELSSNFRFPYFSRNIQEFWKRWHITLSHWFRDYVYFPLGGSKGSSLLTLKNVFVVFALCGLWHGANWTFLCWGLIHAILYVPIVMNRGWIPTRFTNINITTATVFHLFKIIVTFSIVSLSWVFFRSQNISQAFEYLNRLIQFVDFPTSFRIGIVYAIPVLLLDYRFRHNEQDILNFSSTIVRWAVYIMLTLVILLFLSPEKEKAFIYFQF